LGEQVRLTAHTCNPVPQAHRPKEEHPTTDFETTNPPRRDDLVQRIELMEAMIAEGRRATTRFGWIFVMWGLLYYAAIAWEVYLPAPAFAWPACMVLGFVIIRAWRWRLKRSGAGDEGIRSRSISAVWGAMGCAIFLYIGAAAFSHHIMNPAVNAAVLFFLGLAHAISALILRWPAQGAAAAVWWIGGIAIFLAPVDATIYIFLVATFFGMVLFGLYAMMLERQRAASLVQHHA